MPVWTYGFIILNLGDRDERMIKQVLYGHRYGQTRRLPSVFTSSPRNLIVLMTV